MTRARFTCIYCRRSDSDVTPSDAHIFPHVLGGAESTTKTVCEGCNQWTNREVEMPALSTFAFFRLVWGIRGRRNRIPRLRATVSFAGHQAKDVPLNEHGEPDGVIVRMKTDMAGKKSYLLLGPDEQLEAKRQELVQKNPGLQWEDLDPQHTAALAH